MRLRVFLIVIFIGSLAFPLTSVHAEPTLDEQYLRIYLKINDAEHLEKQGDYSGALDDFQDCYTKLAKIHQDNSEWEAALVIERMNDCRTKVMELKGKVDSQVPPPTPPAANGSGVPTLPPSDTADNSDDPAVLKQRLAKVEEDLRITRDNLKDSQTQLDTYRSRLETVNEQLQTLKGRDTGDDRMVKLLNENKSLTDKLTIAQKEIDSFKLNPKSKLALAQTQLKNLQEQFDSVQTANTTLQQTVTTLQQHLDQAQADLIVANKKLADNGPDSPEYAMIKHENEVMRGILERELQEQAHRDEAKRLYQEEYDNLKLKSAKLQEEFDILASPMTPASNDEERALLANLRVSGSDVTPPPSGNEFSAPAASAVTPPVTDTSTNTTAVTPPAPPAPETNAAASAPPTTTNSPTAVTEIPAPINSTPDTSTNTAPAPVATVTPTPSAPNETTPPATNSPAVTPPSETASATPAPTPPSTPAPDAPLSPSSPDIPAAVTPTPAPPAPDNSATTSAAPAETSTNAPPTVSQIPPGTTTYTDTTTVTKDTSTPGSSDPTQYSTKARLPEEMRETAQQAADLFKMQRYDDAAAKYQSIIDKYPECLYAWSNLGVVRYQQGDMNDALKALQQAVKLSPTDAFSYSNLGIVYYTLNQYENAIDALNAAKALDPNDAKTRNYLGCACSQKGWEEVAEKEFRKAIELDPNFADAHFNLALVYATSKPPSIELARREYNRALELGIAKDDRLEKLLGSSTTTQDAAQP